MTVSAVELALEGNLDMFVKSKKEKVRFPYGDSFDLLTYTTYNLQGEKLAIAGLFGDGGAMGVCIDRTCSPARMYGMTELQLNRYTIHELFCSKICVPI